MASCFKIEPRGGPHFDRMVRWLAAHHADQTLLSCPNRTDGAYDVNLTGADVERVSAYGAARYAEAFARLPGGEVAGGAGFQGLETSVVAVVGASTLASHLTFLALQRLGLSAMFLSPRLAESGYAHLLRTTGCRTVLAAAGPALDLMTRRVARAYDDGTLHVVAMLDDDEFLAGLARARAEVREPACSPGLILHTGGTTGLPKPVAFNLTTWLTSFPSSNPVPGPLLCTVPIFHLYGLGSFMICLLARIRLCLLDTHRPVTASIIWRALDATGARTLYTVPYVLKFFAEMEGGVERLAALDMVRSGGSATPEELGNLLIQKGVKMAGGYGQTESGNTMRPYGPGVGEWNWLTPMPSAEKFLKFEKVCDDMYHLVVLRGWGNLKLSDRPDGSYGTQDLFRPHPDNLPGNDTRAGVARWKFVARQGDIVVLANGENADPSPIERAVMLDAHVRMAVAFSAGPERLGLLVVPSEKAAGMSEGDIARAILPSLARGNSLASDYARISPDDVIVKPVGTPYPQTAKMTLQRHILTRLFADDIEALCAARDVASAQTRAVSDGDIRGVVKRVVEEQLQDRVLGFSAAGANGQSRLNEKGILDDDVDFFSLGMDSLLSSLVRRRLQREIPLPDGVTLATNVVFEYPTLRLLSAHIRSLRQGEAVKNGLLARDREATAAAMVEKYSSWATAASGQGGLVPPASSGNEHDVNGQVILLTGATGYIGVQTLSTLLSRPDVSKVYCLVRTRQPQDHDNAAQRVHDALRNSQLLDDLPPPASAKLRCLSSDLAAADLGLSPAEYSKVQSSATAIIHNAWSVNFNMNLESFEPNVASVHHLLNLGRHRASDGTTANKKAPAFVFVSSVAAVVGAVLRGTAGPAATERLYDWREAAPAGGYGQSKWVSERICASAASGARYRGPVRILRVAQVSGDARHGVWNPAEAIPCMVQSALSIGALPRMEDARRNELRWLPCDAAAATIVDLTMLDGQGTDHLAVFHVASPRTLRWNEHVLPAVAEAGLKFRVVSQYEWVRMLGESDRDVERNPPYKLMEHFRKAYGSRGEKDAAPAGESEQLRQSGRDGDGGGTASSPPPRLDLARALKHSSSLRNSPAVDGALLVKYVEFWLRYWGVEKKGR